MDDALKDVAKIGKDELRVITPVISMAVSGTEAPAHCELFSEFGVAVQLVMAALAFSSLLYKRHQEFPQRTQNMVPGHVETGHRKHIRTHGQFRLGHRLWLLRLGQLQRMRMVFD